MNTGIWYSWGFQIHMALKLMTLSVPVMDYTIHVMKHNIGKCICLNRNSILSQIALMTCDKLFQQLSIVLQITCHM